MYFDTHAHYDDEAFDADRDALLDTLLHGEVPLILDPGCTLASSRAALALAHRHEGLSAAVGIHPEELATREAADIDALRELAQDEKCVAIGEIGLDYYWDAAHKEEQKQLFREQLVLALALDLPVIVHDREAHGDSLELVREYPGLRGVFHCYSGSAEMAKELLKLGWYLGFDGPLTYKNARKTVEVLELCPLDRILVETDSPYLSPVPMRGKRNDSRNLAYIIERLAGIKGISPEEAAGITLENGRKLFNIR